MLVVATSAKVKTTGPDATLGSNLLAWRSKGMQAPRTAEMITEKVIPAAKMLDTI